MAKIERRETTRTEELIESGFVKQESRRYMGCSIIGEKCARRLWYKFRLYGKERITPQKNRLFSRGHNEEPIILADLKRIGIKVISTQRKATTASGHISGHNDGILINVPDAPKTKHLFEAKTANEKSWKRLHSGTTTERIKKWSMVYYVQIQTYMHLLKIKRCLFIVVNKNTDERYYERIKYDKEVALAYLERGVDLINSQTPPLRIGNPSFYYCKHFCSDMNEICHGPKKPLKTCRSCEYSEPIPKAKWYCKKDKKVISFKKQLKACKKYSIIKES